MDNFEHMDAFWTVHLHVLKCVPWNY